MSRIGVVVVSISAEVVLDTGSDVVHGGQFFRLTVFSVAVIMAHQWFFVNETALSMPI